MSGKPFSTPGFMSTVRRLRAMGLDLAIMALYCAATYTDERIAEVEADNAAHFANGIEEGRIQ